MRHTRADHAALSPVWVQIDKVSASVQKTKDSLTAKVDDLKEKASSSA
jgi:hypothetical protein